MCNIQRRNNSRRGLVRLKKQLKKQFSGVEKWKDLSMLQRGHHKVVLQLGLKGMQQKETEASKPFQASRIHPRTAYGAHTCTPPGRVGGRASRAVAGRPHVGARRGGRCAVCCALILLCCCCACVVWFCSLPVQGCACVRLRRLLIWFVCLPVFGGCVARRDLM
jgi:hypothetical protein